MIEIEIQRLVWNEVNKTHIWERHQLTREQVEEACYGSPEQLKVEETYNNRYLVLAPKLDGKVLAVVLAPQKEDHTFYPVTARIASKNAASIEIGGHSNTMSEHIEGHEPRKSKIPEFASYEEEAEFWDTHDFTEFKDETRPVKVRATPGLTDPVQVRFDAETNRELEEQATTRGLKKATLIRMWIVERLREERHSQAS